jgi:hypothetical protein
MSDCKSGEPVTPPLGRPFLLFDRTYENETNNQQFGGVHERESRKHFLYPHANRSTNSYSGDGNHFGAKPAGIGLYANYFDLLDCNHSNSV